MGGQDAAEGQGGAADGCGGCDQGRIDGLRRRGGASVRARGREGGSDRYSRRAGRARGGGPARRGHDVRYMHLDVTSEQNWPQVVGAVMAAHGRLDILSNNAGVSFPGKVQDITVDIWDASL